MTNRDGDLDVFEVDDDVLVAETGDATPDEVEGDFTDNSDADDEEVSA